MGKEFIVRFHRRGGFGTSVDVRTYRRRRTYRNLVVRDLFDDAIASLIGVAGPPTATQHPAQRMRIERAPGTRLSSIGEFLLSKKLNERVFQPIIADMQAEYIEALSLGRHGKARWVKWRGYAAFVAAAFAQLPVSAMRLVQKLWTAAH